MFPPFVIKIAIGAALLGVTAGVVGALAVLRRRSLMGDVLAHAALPGICLAYLIFNTRSMLVLSLGALTTGLLGVGVIAGVTRWTRTREDAAMGLTLSTFFGAGIVLLTIVQQQARGNQAGLATYLFGEIAALRTQDVVLIAVVGALLILAVLIFYKEIKTLCFDPEFAQAQGWPTFAMDIAIMGAVAVVTVIGLPVCGVVLMAAMLIFPCVAARYWSNKLGVVLIASGLFGGVAALTGVVAAAPGEGLAMLPVHSLTQGMPPGPLIVMAGTMLFLASALFAPQRGLISRLVRAAQMRLQMAGDHVLRLLFESGEDFLPERKATPLSAVTNRMSASPFTKWLVVVWAKWQGMLEKPTRETVRLTPAGLAAAGSLVRTHRLWERFLVEHADIAADHVHRSADDIEHVLPAALVDSLEQMLESEGRLPQLFPGTPGPSPPHKISQ